MKYKVSVTLCEEVHEADNHEEAMDKFIQNFILADLSVGDWEIEVHEVEA